MSIDQSWFPFFLSFLFFAILMLKFIIYFLPKIVLIIPQDSGTIT